MRGSALGDNENIGKNPDRYICLSAVQQPMIILLRGARLHSRKITAGARLCHRDSEYLLAADNPRHKPVFLLFGSELRYIWRDQIIVQIYIEADIAMAHILLDDALFEEELINASAPLFLGSPCTAQIGRAH